MDPAQIRPTHIYDVSCNGTVPLALAIALRAQDFADTMRWCCSMGGDADTLAAIAKYNITDKIGYISTGGGAFLEFLEGKILPAVEILEARAAN